MQERARIFLVEVQGGDALPDAIRLHAGRVLPRTSIGRKGRWYVAGPGVHEIHAEIMFDGADLHVRSTSPEHPLQIDGAPLASGWTRLLPPCRISLGGVTLAFVALPSEQPSFQTISDLPADAALGATRIEEASLDAVSTRLEISPFLAPPVSAGAPPIDIPPEPPAARKASSKTLESLKSEWRHASFPRKTIIVLLPFAFLTVHLMAKNFERQATWHPGFHAIAASPPALGASAAIPARPRLPPPSALPVPVGASPWKTLDRLAVEAVANNEYAQAAARYDALAQQHPDQAAYREAARILRSKLGDASAP